MMIEVIIKINAEDIAKLDKIGREGLASNGYHQTFQYSLTKAIDEFIKKYGK